jgi:hypothetical protein
LDFVVIGAQKAGTTSLWRYLEDNEALFMPPHKEASFFSEPGYPAQLRGYMRALFKRAPATAKLGKVSPAYMHGSREVPVELVAERIAETLPDVKLVALLRDPVARAHSAHRMLVRRGTENRSFDAAMRELLTKAELEHARRRPEEGNTYVAAGEYGRMLTLYLERFERDQLHVELTADLERDPAAVVRRVCTFLGVEPHEPRRLGERFFPSGRDRVSPEGARDLKEYLDQHVWPHMRHSEQHRGIFEQWFELWNVVPAPPVELVCDETAALLREHYAEDEGVLEAAVGIRVPREAGV